MAMIGNQATQQSFAPAIDYFNGNASTTAFTLSRPVASVAQVQAFIGNVPQNPSSAFTVSGNTITFTSAPPSGTNNIYVYYTSPITQVNGITQNPSIIGDVNASKGLYAAGTFNSAYTDGAVLDYTTGTGRITVGTSDGFKIRNGGTASPTDLVTVDSSGNVGIGLASPTALLDVYKEAQGGKSTFRAYGPAGQILWANVGASTSYLDSDTTIFRQSSASGNAERMRIDSSGNLLVGQSSAGSIRGTSKVQVYNGTVLRSSDSFNGIPCVTIYSATDTTNGRFASFTNSSGTEVGSITRSGASTTAYNTSSDYRLKENIAPMTGALSAVQALKPCTYTWKDDGSSGQGFIAHELQAVVPDCVTGEKDAVDADGNPVYQGIDTSFLVATLTAAIQELNDKVEAQAAEIAALKGQA